MPPLTITQILETLDADPSPRAQKLAKAIRKLQREARAIERTVRAAVEMVENRTAKGA